MKICPYCKRNNDDDVKICLYCYAAIPAPKAEEPEEEESEKKPVTPKKNMRR